MTASILNSISIIVLTIGIVANAITSMYLSRRISRLEERR